MTFSNQKKIIKKSQSFKRVYILSGLISVALALTGIRQFNLAEAILIIIVILWFVPFFIKSNSPYQHKLTLIISTLHLLWVSYAVRISFHWLNTATSLEGPRGEGAPGATILGVVLGSCIMLIPWALTMLRALTLCHLSKK